MIFLADISEHISVLKMITVPIIHNGTSKFGSHISFSSINVDLRFSSFSVITENSPLYTPRTKIRQTVSAQVQENKFIRDSIDRGNMKIASIAKNIIAQYGIEPENIGAAALAAYAQKGKLVNELNTLQTQIEDLTAQLKVLKKYRKVKVIAEELKKLSGRQEKKFQKEHSSELQEYGECRKQILKWYPSGITPKVEKLEQKINALKQERSQKNDEYRAVKQKSDDLAKARQEIESHLKNEREVSQQKRKKRNDLE